MRLTNKPLLLLIFFHKYSHASEYIQKIGRKGVESKRHLQTSVSLSVANAIDDITDIIQSNVALAAKFVRLGFHDCVGGCDGCVDLTNADNAGLDIPIDALRSVVTTHEQSDGGLSRADIWALAAITGADFTRPGNDIFFSMEYFGRINCEENNATACLDADGNDVPCAETRGPHRELPPADIDTEDLLDFSVMPLNLQTKRLLQ